MAQILILHLSFAIFEGNFGLSMALRSNFQILSKILMLTISIQIKILLIFGI